MDLKDKMLAAAYAHGKEEVLAAMGRAHFLSMKEEPLTEEEIAELKAINEVLRYHPAGSEGMLENLLPLRGLGPRWLDEHIQETLWSWAWWADYFGMPIGDYMSDHPKSHVEAVKASLPYPEGWAPESRR